MPEPTARGLRQLFAARRGFPTERDWERSVVLEPRTAPRRPALVSDGAGLPFAPEALDTPAATLDAADPAVAVLVAQLARQKDPAADSGLPGWRELARTEDQALFGRGRPPHLVTVAVHREAPRGAWRCLAVSSARPLRATREGIRASGWRPDPTREPQPEDTVLRVLLTEQTWAGGTRADRRLLAPDLYRGDDELVLTMFVTPREGFQVRSRNPETPVRISLPTPIGHGRLLDGALYA